MNECVTPWEKGYEVVTPHNEMNIKYSLDGIGIHTNSTRVLSGLDRPGLLDQAMPDKLLPSKHRASGREHP